MGILAHWLYPGPFDYSADEKKRATRILISDAVGIPVFTGVYYCLHAALKRVPAPAAAVSLGQNAGAGYAAAGVLCLVLYQHCLVVLMPLKRDEMMWKVQGYLGRWVFLTRQVLTLQAIHSVVSVFQPEVANTMCTLVAGFGVFVTVQYFTLVHWDPDFLASVRLFKTFGVPLREQMAWQHLPAGILGLADVLCIKPREAVLAALPNTSTTASVVLVYVLLYLTLIHVNFSWTTEFPYGILRPFGSFRSNPKAWLNFAGVQTLILGSFTAAVVLLAKYAPALTL
ncbi:hypothetical protein DIPPA_10481 [Diplonema papillatum]|nr:hypothetical protein DIPPA_10481 [Diplonema papillatum]|eukprot:gene14700-22489_t